MTAWLAYAAGSAVLLVLGAAGWGLVLDPADGRAVWVAAAVAYPVQLLAFALLVAVRDRTRFMIGWAGGMVLRLLAVAGLAFWVTRYGIVPAAPALLGLVGFVFVLALVEPLFLRLAR